MSDTLKFRGLSTVEITSDNVSDREIVLDTDVNQIAFANNGNIYSFYSAGSVDATLSNYALLSGANFTGAVVLFADPTGPMDAVTKQYVDNISGGGGQFGVSSIIAGSGISVDQSTGDVTISATGGGGGGGGGSIDVSNTPPSNPSEGDLWWDSDSGKTYIYYTDGSSNQWVETGSTPAYSEWSIVSGGINYSGGNVGIGSTTPSERLVLADEAEPSGFSATGMSMIRSDYGGRISGYIDQGVGHGIVFDTIDNATPSEKLRILSSGGITFNGDTSQANALDDYEEGTWTPTIGGATAYAYQDGTYTKIGNRVWVNCRVQATAATPSGSNWFIGGLPFTSAPGDVWGGAARSYGRNLNGATFADLNWHVTRNSNGIFAYNKTGQIKQNTSGVILTEILIMDAWYTVA